MANVPLKVIPEPAPNTRTVFLPDNSAPDFVFFQGNGATTHVCGACARPLTRNLPKRFSFKNIVFKCPGCGAFNDTKDAPS